MRGQGAIMDGLFLMMIASSCGVTLIYVAGLYGSNTNIQTISLYNYEYGGNAMVALQYASLPAPSTQTFWTRLEEVLDPSSTVGFTDFMDVEAATLWADATRYAPTEKVYLCVKKDVTVPVEECYTTWLGTLDPKSTVYVTSAKLRLIHFSSSRAVHI